MKTKKTTLRTLFMVMNARPTFDRSALRMTQFS